MKPKQTWRYAVFVLRPYSVRLAVLSFIFAIRAILAGAGDPLVTKWLIDSIVARQFKRFVLIAFVSLILYTLLRLANAASERLTNYLSVRVSGDLSLKLLVRFFQLPYKEISQRDNAYFVSRIYDEPTVVSETVILGLQLLNSVVMLLGASAVCFWISWKIAIIVAVVASVLRLISSRYSSRISGITVEEKERQAAVKENMGRSIQAYKTVNLFGLRDAVHTDIGMLMQRYFEKFDLRVRHSSAFRALSGIFLSYAEQSVMIAAGFEVIRGQLTVGSLFGMLSAYGRVVRALESLISLTPSLATVKGQFSRIQALAEMPIALRAAELGSVIEFSGATFSMNGRLILNQFRLAIRSHEKVLVTGPNGSGKSTLMHIITGFFDTTDGAVKLPPLEGLSALLTPFHFIPGTVRDNVNYNALSQEKRASFETLVERFDLKSKEDQDPETMSEGEKRKVQIIMTLLKDADFYIFDEPLTNVDDSSCETIMNEIFAAVKQKALIVVMHGGERYRHLFDCEYRMGDAIVEHEPLALSTSPDAGL